MSTTKTSARTKPSTKPMERSSGRNGSDPAGNVAAPNTPPRDRSTLSDLIDSILARSREADPHVLARRNIGRLTEEQVRELALVGFTDRISRQMATVRSGGVSAPTRSIGKSKWQIAQRVWVSGEHKFLRDCDLSDLAMLADQHRDIAARNLNRAEEYEQLAEALRESGCVTVGELWEQKDLAA